MGEIAVVAREQRFVAEISVLAEGDVAEQVISQRIDADGASDRLGVSDVTFGFAHLLLLKEEPAVGENGFWKRLLRSQEEGRPIDAMEADDFLADQMELRGPIPFPLQFVVAVADAAEIAGVCVIRDVSDLLGIVWRWQASFLA